MLRERLQLFARKHRRLAKIFSFARRPAVAAVKFGQYRHIRSRTAKVELLERRPIEFPDGNRVALIACVRNEADTIQGFLSYYRSIGIREFYIVDNGSDDGTLELLEANPDVYLYATTDGYRNAHYGTIWINWIMHRHARNRWALFVDADELLFYRNSENVLIDALLDELESHGQSYLYTPLIDLYDYDAARISDAKDAEQLHAALKDCHHDSIYEKGPPLANGVTALRGGPRMRLAAGSAYPPPCLDKFPLVKITEKTLFTASSHEFIPMPAERHCITGWLVHLKLGSNALKRHGNALTEFEHYAAGRERVHLRMLEPGKLRIPGNSVRFEGERSLRLIDRYAH